MTEINFNESSNSSSLVTYSIKCLQVISLSFNEIARSLRLCAIINSTLSFDASTSILMIYDGIWMLKLPDGPEPSRSFILSSTLYSAETPHPAFDWLTMWMYRSWVKIPHSHNASGTLVWMTTNALFSYSNSIGASPGPCWMGLWQFLLNWDH